LGEATKPNTVKKKNDGLKSKIKAIEDDVDTGEVKTDKKRKLEDTDASITHTITASTATRVITEPVSVNNKQPKGFHEQDLSAEEELKDVFSAKLSLPVSLKRHMVEEWALISSSKKLLRLPKEPARSVASALRAFVASKAAREEVWQELADSVSNFFCRALPSLLLYRQERDQLHHLLDLFPLEPLSDLYGPEHLLRLFVRLPRLLPSESSLPAQEMASIAAKLAEVIKFLGKTVTQWFSLAQYSPVDDAMAFASSSLSLSLEGKAAAVDKIEDISEIEKVSEVVENIDQICDGGEMKAEELI
jgi:hypothetical protein